MWIKIHKGRSDCSMRENADSIVNYLACQGVLGRAAELSKFLENLDVEHASKGRRLADTRLLAESP